MELLKLLILVIELAAGVMGLVLFGFLLRFVYRMRPRRSRETGFPYIYVDNAGEARELDDDERAYLNTEFQGGDGARPYIKDFYESLTPEGHLHGYLRRRQLPKQITITPAP